MATRHILILLTSHASLGDTGRPTGFWLEELAVPYWTFTRAGVSVTLASPQGGKAPADPRSLTSELPEVKDFLADPTATGRLDHTARLADLDITSFDAIFVAGGHGTMWDLATPEVGAVLSKAWAAGKVLAAVCHGPAALVSVKAADGRPVVAGRRFAAFTNEEEAAVELTHVVPFLLATKLSEEGGHHVKGPMWEPLVVVDGRLVTGQNPGSSKKVAEATLGALGGLGR